MERLLTLKHFCETIDVDALTEMVLSPAEWSRVEQVLAVLGPFNTFTKKLQSTTTTLSDFYGYWMLIRIKLSQAEDSLSRDLLDEMNRYHEMLMENPVILASIYLDPRYQRGLKEKKSLAIAFLVELYSRIERVEAKTITSSAVTDGGVEEESDCDGNRIYEDLENYLNACQSIDQTSCIDVDERLRIEALLRQFWNVRAPLQTSVLSFWEKNKMEMPILYKLAAVMNAIPPTQTTVERAFSALALTLTSHRTRLGDTALQNILLLRLNNDLYDKDTSNSDDFIETFGESSTEQATQS